MITKTDLFIFAFLFFCHIWLSVRAGGKSLWNLPFAVPGLLCGFLITYWFFHQGWFAKFDYLETGGIIPCGFYRRSEYSISFLDPCTAVLFQPLYSLAAFAGMVLFWRKGWPKMALSMFGYHLVFLALMNWVLFKLLMLGVIRG